jgi:hypothetical protein
LLALVDVERRTATRAGLTRALAGRSAAELAAWAAELGKRQKSGSDIRIPLAASEVFRHWLQANPAGAAEYALRSGAGSGLLSELGHEVESAVAGVFEADPEEAIRLLRLMAGQRELYIYARHRCIERMNGMGPREALEFIVDLDARTGNDRHDAQSLGDFPMQWVESDARGAMEWALALPPGFTRSWLVRTMGGNWAGLDPAAAREFIDAVPRTTLAEKSETRLAIMAAIERSGQK